MKQLSTILLLFFCITAVAVPHHKKKKKIKPVDVLSVSIRRTGCYGRCPDYSIKIDANGTTTYTGRHFVTDTGTFQKNISDTAALRIFNEVSSYDLDTCKNVYPSRIADLPGMILTIEYTSHIKSINNANFGPRFLSLIAADIDNAGKKTDSTGWTKIK